MPVMLFKLRGVEDDEADDIRNVLSEHGIDFYETTNGRWGLGYAAIWLRQEEFLPQAKMLIQDYQQQRFLQARERYAKLCLEGKQQTMWDVFKDRPIQVILTFVAIAIVSFMVLMPFLVF